VARPLRKAFSDLGATYVKLGQLMASAPSVFGEDVSTEFRSLLDSGRPVGFDRIRHELEKATEPARSDRPIGRASMAVVQGLPDRAAGAVRCCGGIEAQDRGRLLPDELCCPHASASTAPSSSTDAAGLLICAARPR
jgi:hypothetical protein